MSNSLTKKSYFPPQAEELGTEHVFIYNGRSMSPTFQPGHLLYVSPRAQNLAAGDIVVYIDSQHHRHVVHRVIEVTHDGLVTRGDNNLRQDVQPIAFGQVVGRVDAVELGGRLKSITGGRWGLKSAQIRWGILALWVKLCILLGTPYRAIKGSLRMRQMLRWIFRPHFEVIRLQTPTGQLVKVLHRGQVVARTQAGGTHLECRKPYDLFLDEGNFLL